jgi:hypothetical protein
LLDRGGPEEHERRHQQTDDGAQRGAANDGITRKDGNDPVPTRGPWRTGV